MRKFTKKIRKFELYEKIEKVRNVFNVEKEPIRRNTCVKKLQSKNIKQGEGKTGSKDCFCFKDIEVDIFKHVKRVKDRTKKRNVCLSECVRASVCVCVCVCVFVFIGFCIDVFKANF